MRAARPLALFYFDYFKRDNKNGGGRAWMSPSSARRSCCTSLPVVYNVRKPAEAGGRPNLRSSGFTDVTDHVPRVRAMRFMACLRTRAYSDAGREPLPRGTSSGIPLGSSSTNTGPFIPEVFSHYARHYQKPARLCRKALAAKIKKAQNFNVGLWMDRGFWPRPNSTCQWHILPARVRRSRPR